MRATTTRIIRARLRWVLAFVAAWAVAFSMSLAAGVAPAYASSDSLTSTVGSASATTPADSAALQEGAGSSENASTPGKAAAATETGSSQNASTPKTQVEAAVSSANNELAPAGAPHNEVIATTGSSQGELQSSSNGPSYPGDDGTDEIFIGISSSNSKSYYVSPESSITRDPESNAVYIDVSSEVGRGVDLAIEVDYIRIGGTSYDANSNGMMSVALPTESLETTPRTVYAGHLMTSLYAGTAPLGQGSYRADVASSENPGMSSGANHYDVDARCFEWYYGVPASALQDRIGCSAGRSGSIVIRDSICLTPADDGLNPSELYFETPGRRVFTMQFTYLQEFRETRADEEGEYTLVSYLLYVSNPVIFRVDVADKPTIGLSLDLISEDGNPVNYDEGYLDVVIRKEHHGYNTIYGGTGALCNWGQPFRYQYATDGTYFIEIRHSTGLYEPLFETVTISLVDYLQCVHGGSDYVAPITLRPVFTFYTVTFYAEDGVTVLPVSGANSKQYRENTFSAIVERPTPPIKEEDESGRYVFSGWRLLSGLHSPGYDGVGDVISDASYAATYRLIPTMNEPQARFVYATGGLFGRAKPAGVASYQLTSEVPSDAARASIIEEHSGMIASSKVLGVFEVGITQHNDDGTTASVTEGVGDLNLAFDLEGVEDGTKVRVLQLHETGDPDNPEVIEHNNLVVEGGKVSLTLNDKLSMFIILEDGGTSRHMFDDGSDDVFIGLAPMPFGEHDYIAGAYPGSGSDESIYVPINITVGEGLDLGVVTDYIRVGNNEATDGWVESLDFNITEDSTDPDAWNYVMFSWYNGESPLSQGTYYSDLDAYKKATGSSSAGSAHALPTYEAVDINAMAYIWQSAFYGYDSGSGREYYTIPNRFQFMNYFNGVDPASGNIAVQVVDTVTASRNVELFFPYAGTYTYTAQVTYVKEIIDHRTDESGEAYNFVSHIVYASVPVKFVINVSADVPMTELVVKAVDENGDPVDISDFSKFEVSMHKQYRELDSIVDDEVADPYYPGETYALASWRDRYFDTATAGKYKIAVSHMTGLYEDYVGVFFLTDGDIANATNRTVTKTIHLQSVAMPAQYSVKFLDDSGALITPPGERFYNENTHWSAVQLPTTKPVSSKPDTDDVMYVFYYWQVEGTTGSTPDRVTENLVMVPYFKEVPKKDKLVTPRVYASGGLFTKQKDPDVVSHVLTAIPYELTSSEAKAIISGHSSAIGSNTVLGLFDVGITRYKTDGTEELVTEGVGALGLTFDLSGAGVADGTIVKVIQIHKKDDSSPEELIEHEGAVMGGSVSITLNDKLSTFIIVEDLDAQGGSEGDGEGQNDDVDIVPSNPSSGDDGSSEAPAGGEAPASETPAASDPASESPGTEEPAPSASDDVSDFIGGETNDNEDATRAMPADDSRGEGAPEVVKAGPSADDGKMMPQTGDATQPLTPVLLVLLAAFGVTALYARRRALIR